MFHIVLGVVIWVGLSKVYPDKHFYPRTVKEVYGYLATGVIMILIDISLILIGYAGVVQEKAIISVADALLLRVISIQASFIMTGYAMIVLSVVGLILIAKRRSRVR